MNREDLEPWQRVFHDRYVQEQERRMSSVPDYGDKDLYGPGPGEDDE
jgi:hypothetical protein